MKILVFDVKGKFALFRRSYTTTSSTTYPFPPRTAICGIIAAILGIENPPDRPSWYLRKFDNARISIRLLNPIKKIRLGINYVETKPDKDTPRTQILAEIIKDPAYRIYISEFEKFDELVKLIRSHECVFTPYLGLSEFIADFSYVGVFEAKKVSLPTLVNSVVKIIDGTKSFPERGTALIRERMVLRMDDKRTPLEFAEYWVEKNGKALQILEYSEDILEIEELNERICWID
ncbi:type I-B CRISPR-associated protein Cas5b [Pseudothermotoga thermarum]|nr:type I-B CRISPR-associated protein Cas5b [Pseudothermotoga thermarum]